MVSHDSEQDTFDNLNRKEIERLQTLLNSFEKSVGGCSLAKSGLILNSVRLNVLDNFVSSS